MLWLQAYPGFHWGRYSDGVEILQRALALYQKVVPPDDVLEVNVRNDLSACLAGRFDDTDARVHSLRAAELLDRLPPHCVAERVRVLANRSIGEPDAEIRSTYAQRACALASSLPVTDLQRVAAELVLANALAAKGRVGDALEKAELQKTLLITAFGRQHTEVENACRILGFIHTANGDFELALSAIDEASDLRHKLRAEDWSGASLSEHNRAEVRETYARSLWKTDRSAARDQQTRAVEHEREALRLRRQALPRQSEGVTIAIYFAAAALWRLGELTKDPAHRREAMTLAVEGLRVGRQDTEAYAQLQALQADFAAEGIPGFQISRRSKLPK